MRKSLLTLVVLILASSAVFAQEAAVGGPASDLSAGFPTSIIDTVTLPISKWEVGVSAGYVTQSPAPKGVFDPGTLGSAYEPMILEVTYGVTESLQLTAKWPLIIGEADINGNGDTVLGAVWGIVKDEGAMPAMGIELAAKFPTGSGFTGYDGTITGIVSKAFGSLRVFGNAGYTTIGKDLGPSAKSFIDLDGDLDRDGDEVAFGKRSHTDSYKIGAAYMAMDNVCVIVDVLNNMSVIEGRDRITMVEGGARFAVTEVDTIGAGIGIGLGNGNATPDFTATVSYQRAL
jgi:hypothetical protein